MNSNVECGHSSVVNDTHSCSPASKWAALIEDTVVWAPQRIVKARVLLTQAGVGRGKILVRDHGDENDLAIQDEEEVNLALGNVFYVVSPCDAPQSQNCLKPAKLAWFVDDRPEITLTDGQTGKSLRELFTLKDDVLLIRDYESSQDEPIGLTDAVRFDRGPVFITRRQHKTLHIIVNSKPFTEVDGVKKQMTGREIALLISSTPDATKVYKIEKNVPEEQIPLDKSIPIHNCDEFRVIRNNVEGGFEPSRIQKELGKLKEGGFQADFIQHPFPAVIYRDVPTRSDFPHVRMTDVLVAVPGGYPGGMIDGAYLPQGSLLLHRVKGQVQGTIEAEGKQWQLVSYHPHNGGGGPAWDKNKHGFHTYIDELLCWIHHARN